jgi:hypothetical protein
MTDREILGKRVRKPKQFNSKEEEEEDLKFWSKMGVVAPDKPEGEQ